VCTGHNATTTSAAARKREDALRTRDPLRRME